MGQGQPRDIIWKILVVLTYTMLHTKFQGHRSLGSGEEDFLRFLPYMGMAAILVMWPEPFEQLFVPPIPGGYIWNLVTIGPVVSEEKSFEIVDGRRTTTDDDGACLYYKLPRSLRLRWAKNVQTTPTHTYYKRNRPLPYCNQNCRMPRHWKFTQHHRTTNHPNNGMVCINRALETMSIYSRQDLFHPFQKIKTYFQDGSTFLHLFWKGKVKSYEVLIEYGMSLKHII